MPVTSVPTSSATVAIATFITDVSRVIRNWPAASVTSTSVAPAEAPDPFPVISHARCQTESARLETERPDSVGLIGTLDERVDDQHVGDHHRDRPRRRHA